MPVGRSGGVGRPAVKVHFQIGAGNELLPENGAAFGMGGDNGVHAVEQARLRHGNLAARIPDIAFLGGGAENMNRSRGQGAGQGNARAAAATPNMLCPQACPSTGRASYSARKAIWGAWPEPAAAWKAVGMPSSPRSTVKPFASRSRQGGRKTEFLIAQFRFGKDRGGDLLHLRR